MPEPTTSGNERTAPAHASTPAGDLVSDDEAARVADELLGPPVASHVTRAYCRDGGGAFGDLVAAALGARAGRGAGGFDRRLAALTTTQVLGSLLRVTIAGRLMRGAA